MEYKIRITDQNGNVREYTAIRNDCDEKTLNDFIFDCLSISEDKRELPLKIQCPNGLEVYPNIKMKFTNYGHPMSGDKLEAMHITWRD